MLKEYISSPKTEIHVLLFPKSLRFPRVKGIARCAFPCRSPVYRLEHYSLARNLIFGAAVAGIFVNICVLVSVCFSSFREYHWFGCPIINAPVNSPYCC